MILTGNFMFGGAGIVDSERVFEGNSEKKTGNFENYQKLNNFEQKKNEKSLFSDDFEEKFDFLGQK